MRFTRPKPLRPVSAPHANGGVALPVQGQTLRTLQMLKNMGYSEVWCKGDEVDEQTIDLALIEGWRVCDADGTRIKFTLRPATPQPGAAPRRPPYDRDEYSRASVRTVSPTDLTPEPMPSPLALYRRAYPNDATEPGELAELRADPVAWGRRPSAEPPPSVVVSPPPEDEDEFMGGNSDYFTFVPVPRQEHLNGWTPPRGSWLDRRQQGHESVQSEASHYSRDSFEDLANELTFEFDEVDPFGTRGQHLADAPPLSVAPLTFRPHTPELRIPIAPRSRAGSGQNLDPTQERPSYTLNRVYSDPGHATPPSFELLPLLPPRWRCRDT